MNRREALGRVCLILGGTVIGGEFFLSGCKSNNNQVKDLFTQDNITLLNEVGETILPETTTPGARAADVGSFMVRMVNDCYTSAEQKIFIQGISRLDEASNKKFGKRFLDIHAQQKNDLLTSLDKEQNDYTQTKKPEYSGHYFTMMKQLTLLGYFTSEVGATKALRYVPVPGKYIGNIPYKKGDKAWAL